MTTTRSAPPRDRVEVSTAAVILGIVLIGALALVAIAGLAIAFGQSEAEATPNTTIDVNLTEFAIEGNLVAPAGEVTLRVMNSGSVDHNLAVPALAARTPNFGSGRSELLSLGRLSPGTYEIVCEVAGHSDAGMKATLTIVGEGVDTVSAGDAQGHGHGDMSYAEMDEAMMNSILRYVTPGQFETAGVGNPVLEVSEVLPDGTKVFDLEAKVVDWEVEPGKFVEAWTYNGVVPAPQIIVDRGDKVQVRLLNNLPMGTDIHWHGVHTPNSMDGVAPVTQELVPANGGTFTYEFVADEDAIGMYHPHHHAQLQVVNGMFGVFKIGENPVPRGSTISGVTIPEDLEISQDIPLILNDAGTIGYSINGKSFPATEKIVVDQGDWITITYYNEGLQIHPMHLHQFPQLVYAKDGVPLEQPYWTDTLNIAPGERYTVLVQPNEPGVWVWHCHILTHVERTDGMFGMVTAIVVNENPDFDPDEAPVRPSNWRLEPTEVGS